MKTRRELLKAIAVAPVAASAHQAHSDQKLVQITKRVAPQVFDAERFPLLTRLVDLIIPRSDTPGAADVGVQYQIDGAAAANPELRKRFERGLAALDSLARAGHGKAFLELAPSGQVAVLQAASGDARSDISQFFQLAKEMTIDGYYSTREGLEQELGWHGNTFLSSFPGCTHPEHQS
jgi:hypothetical protein